MYVWPGRMLSGTIQYRPPYTALNGSSADFQTNDENDLSLCSGDVQPRDGARRSKSLLGLLNGLQLHTRAWARSPVATVHILAGLLPI